MLSLLLLALFSISVCALYSAKSSVSQLGANDFDKEVMKYPGVVIVEFYAPWCGHCKQLAPEYEKAAKILDGVVKVVAVDATVHESLAQKYQIQGFPTIKVFGADKKKPVDYQGQRTADALVSEGMRAANQLVKDRKAGKGKKSDDKSDKGDKKEKKGKKAPKSAVIELNEANFDALVLDSNDHWLVEFYAPWCGHCKKLAPEWEKAAARLATDGVKLGAIDATVHTNLAQKYGIKGFPTIKVFGAGPKGAPADYNGPREADGIVEFALQSLEASGAPVPIHQITGSDVFTKACGDKNVKVCAVLFLPHILDTGAKGRNEYLELFQDVAKSFRKMPFAFLWTEAGAQESLENAIELNGNIPTVAVLSLEKKVYAVPKVSWNKKNIQTFLSGILSGR
jgi:protein disulfide-isomerase A6